MSDMQQIAKLLQSKGRYGDTVLAHISPKEAEFLRVSTDGTVNTNPDTGLPEFYGGGGMDGNGGDYGDGGNSGGDNAGGYGGGSGANSPRGQDYADAVAQSRAQAQSALTDSLMNAPNQPNQRSFMRGMLGRFAPNPEKVGRIGTEANVGSLVGDALKGLAFTGPTGLVTGPAMGAADRAIARGLQDTMGMRATGTPSVDVAANEAPELSTPTFGGKQRGTMNNGEGGRRLIANALMGPRST